MPPSRPSTSFSSTSSQYPYQYSATPSNSNTRPPTTRPGTARSGTNRSRSRASSGFGVDQQIICAVNESRGVSPTVGIALVNISTGEAVLSQICDNQFYVRTLNKLQVFDPTVVLVVSIAGSKSKMHEVIEENLRTANIVPMDRKYWSEATGLKYIEELAFKDDLEALKFAIGGNYFATCCFCAVLHFIDFQMSLKFAFHSLRIQYQPSEGSMMIDLSTIQSLELIQNLQDAKSRQCLFGLMNHTLTPMGARLLRSTILQPSTQVNVLNKRFDAVEELTQKDTMFLSSRQAIQPFRDIEKLLTKLIIIPQKPNMAHAEQSINNILLLKGFAAQVPRVNEALQGARSDLLSEIRDQCRIENVTPTLNLITEYINEDVTFHTKPLDLRNQRTYAVKANVSGLLDVARQTFKEATEDVHQHVDDINHEGEIRVELRYDNPRGYWLRISGDFSEQDLPDSLVNVIRKKGYFECQTLHLMKLNRRIQDSHQEVVLLSDATIQELLDKIRGEISNMFKMCQAIGMLDMIAAFAQLATDSQDYARPKIDSILTIESGRHPIKENHLQNENFVPNDVFASQACRFQIITGCNMSGKSTYIKTVALISVMAQVGSFVPADSATVPIIHQLFARVSMDDNIEANASTFASEMRETAFILRNIEENSIAIIDELGRGTSTRDGLAIALSIAEALIESGAFVWFATHFRELAQILGNRPGVINQHLEVDMADEHRMAMTYKIREGVVREHPYGLALARVVDLPVQILEIAEEVSQSIREKTAARRCTRKTLALSKKRKLVLALSDTLSTLRDGEMQGDALLAWVLMVRAQFVKNMDRIDREAESSDADDDEEASVDGEEGISEQHSSEATMVVRQ
ncbi:DNA mismatch repair protein Msh4 [Coleophoma cylindrospora]|uniref:DNA mismatch repair protein MSH3 n=1 Tax=Coleophoma cylindrospora TaxID=1849047 RepID=A0A3D8RSV8_9HELO|nr:DNA mismatch repair protein Msh4 [Coleophoma cylindrospora]